MKQSSVEDETLTPEERKERGLNPTHPENARTRLE